MTGRRPRRAVSPRRNLAGWAALVLGAAGLATALGGWLVAMSLGTILAADTDRPWGGERIYVVGDGGQDVACVVGSADGESTVASTVVLLGPGPRNPGLDLAATSRTLSPGGRHLTSAGDATLRCDGDVRVTTGFTALLTVPAEHGLWVVGPSAGLIVAGSALRRTQVPRLR